MYKVGDKVKYSSGGWWFYGTVKAVIENAIGLSYRIIVDRMENRNCNLSMTQFDFEISPDDGSDKTNKTSEKVVSKRGRKTKNEVRKEEKEEAVAVKPKKGVAKKSKKKITRGKWEDNFEKFKRGETSSALYNWVAQNRTRYATGELDEDKIKKLMEINFSFESNRKKNVAAEADAVTDVAAEEQPQETPSEN
jgi:hypothetical protein